MSYLIIIIPAKEIDCSKEKQCVIQSNLRDHHVYVHGESLAVASNFLYYETLSKIDVCLGTEPHYQWTMTELVEEMLH